uniref:uncharacterized protein LOC105351643 n=1 Tax=Fragaria vesca subsp. vesca TaxID=101020 RepID=UPI0005C7FADF|nr:PREDICTED: uncharacterized protein LOC105351643 [Fragaria vesca subsp. vesca]
MGLSGVSCCPVANSTTSQSQSHELKLKKKKDHKMKLIWQIYLMMIIASQFYKFFLNPHGTPLPYCLHCIPAWKIKCDSVSIISGPTCICDSIRWTLNSVPFGRSSPLAQTNKISFTWGSYFDSFSTEGISEVKVRKTSLLVVSSIYVVSSTEKDGAIWMLPPLINITQFLLMHFLKAWKGQLLQ